MCWLEVQEVEYACRHVLVLEAPKHRLCSIGNKLGGCCKHVLPKRKRVKNTRWCPYCLADWQARLDDFEKRGGGLRPDAINFTSIWTE